MEWGVLDMGMKDYPISGYGFEFSEVEWNLKAINRNKKVLSRYGISKGDGDLFKTADDFDDELFEVLLEETVISYEASSENADYLIIYDLKPYEVGWLNDFGDFDTEEKVKEYFWSVFEEYIKTPKESFFKALGEIADTYCG